MCDFFIHCCCCCFCYCCCSSIYTSTPTNACSLWLKWFLFVETRERTNKQANNNIITINIIQNDNNNNNKKRAPWKKIANNSAADTVNWKDLRVRFVCVNEFAFCVPVWLVCLCAPLEKAITEKRGKKQKRKRARVWEKSVRIKSGIQPNGKRHKIAIKAVASENPLCMYSKVF